MTLQKPSIAVIAPQDASSGVVVDLLQKMPGFKVDRLDGTLAGINGTALKLAGSHDMIIFRTGADGEADLDAVQAITSQPNRKAKVLALCDAGTTLADIRRLTNAGVSDVLPDTLQPQELEETIRRFSAPAKAIGSHGAKPGRVISIAQARGGIGATTVAVNLADQLLHRSGHFRKTAKSRVALVDLDLQFGAIGSFLDVAANPALYTMAMDNVVPDATFLEQAMAQTASGLSVLAAPAGIAPLNALNKVQVLAMIQTLQASHDYVVVDLPRALVEWISPVLQLSDRLLLVSDSSVPSVQQARRLIDIYREDNLGLQVEVIMNHEKKPLIAGRHHTEAAKVLERKFRHWLPHDPKAAAEAADRGKPLSQVAARSGLNKAIARLARDLTEELVQAASVAKAH